MAKSFQFEALLARQNLTEKDLRQPIQKKIREIRKVMAGIADTEATVAAGDLTKEKEAECKRLIADSRAGLEVMDVEVVTMVNKWLTNREKFKANGARLTAASAKTREAKTGNPAAPAAQEPAEPAPPKPNTPALAPAVPKPSNKQNSPTPASEPAAADAGDKKSRIGVLGWVLIVVGIGVLGGAGVMVARQAAERRA